MSDKDDTGLELGVYGRKTEAPRIGPFEIAAAVATVLWLVVASALMGLDGTANVLAVLAFVLPVAMIWTAALALKTAQRLRDEAAHLQKSVDALRHAQVVLTQMTNSAVRREAAPAPARPTPPPAPPRDPISARPAATPAPAPSDPQPVLELDPAPEPRRPPITVDEFIRAMNFPNDQDDRAGFRALARAMDDPDAGKVVRAAQDILTLLSQDGIYMDDLVPDRSRPELWRRFAEGERGKAIADLGGVRDRIPLGLTAKRMREDVVFRDAAHHFLRYFDRTFAAFAPEATDQEIADLAETRSARAFMLLGRVSGTFD